MKKLQVLFLLIFTVLSVTAQDVKKLTILHTNDLHSRLLGFAPESAYTPLSVNDDKTEGGFARMATIIKNEKALNDSNTLLVDAGDFMMGTLFPSIEKETGFQLRLMKEMGYDVVGLGNHEYEFGPEWLASVIGTSAAKGAIPPLLIGNAKFDSKDTRDDGLERELSSGILLRKKIIEKDGLKIGFFSLLGKNAAGVAPNATPVTFEKQVPFARRMVKELKAEHCNIIICLSHSGVTLEKDGKWGGEDVELARKVKGLDVIISGHTHTRLEKPVMVNNIPIVQTGEFGENIGRLELSYSNGKLNVASYKLIHVNDSIMGDARISGLIDEEKKIIDKEILNHLGLEYGQTIAESGFRLEGNDLGDYKNSNLGPFIADAIHYYVNKHNKQGTDVSMVAAGMIFDKIVPGILTVPDIFRVMPLGSGKDNVPGYALSRVYVTGKELKSILEILQMAGKSKAEDYCYYSGIKVEYNPDKGLLNKVRKIEIIHPDGTASEVNFSKKDKTLYSVTADSYMLELVGIIKKMSFGLINVVPKDSSGKKVTDMKTAVIDMDENKDGVQEGKEWLALTEYLSSMKDTNGNGIPDLDNKYVSPPKCFIKVNH